MKRRIVLSAGCAAAAALACFAWFAAFSPSRNFNVVEAAPGKVTQGALQILNKDGQASAACPLKRTDVKTEITGSLARVNVTQEFQNPLAEKIEAVYVFPLPQNAAVDDMTMLVGDRTVKGKIKRREEARMIYEVAREAGQVAGLLDQERPNIFTQSVANITPGATVKITISYVEFLKYDEGAYEFVFPMVVGPRYIPGEPTGSPSEKRGAGWAPDTGQVPDASRITPQVTPPGTRAGHDISINVALDAGVPIDSLQCASHEVNTNRPASNQAVVELRNETTIPNKDFVLKFDVVGKKISDAVMTHRGPQGGFFSMIFQPPDRVTAADVAPKELVFVLDTSGSMQGFPVEKAKETMKLALDALYPEDTFNLITFAGDTHILFPQPKPATRENLRLAQVFLASRQGSGGTEMMKAIRAALEPSDKQDHVRIVCFMTDGYIGNDFEIVGEVQKHPNARVFSFGIGSSVNRYLLDKMAEAGRGEVEYVALTDDGSAAAKRFHERVRNPLMTDIEIDWSGLPVADVYPKRIPDLFSAKPLILTGRYTAGARGVVRLKGRLAGREFTREIPVELPESRPRHDVLATLWARTRIDDLMSQDYQGIQNGNPQTDVREAITQLGLEYRLMTQFTSFVAVEETVVTDGGQPRRIDVPVEMPEGVSYEGVFGRQEERKEMGRAKLNQGAMKYSQSVIGGPLRASADSAAVPAATPPSMTPGTMGRTSPAKPAASSGGGGKNEVNKRSDKVRGIPDPRSPLPESQGNQQLLSKLHPSIAAVIERLKNKVATPGANEAKFVSNGKAEVQVWLTDKSPAAIEQLKKLGFEILVNSQSSKLIIGRLPIEKLMALAEIAAVKYVAPQTK
ncbi:MAG: VIT domain-containing protein [Blastocatellia bacterium]